MAQTGYTPILIYSSSTTTNAPAVGNLTNSTLGSELAINITDGKLFYKDNANAIQVIGWKVRPATAGGTGLTSFAVGDTIYADSTTTLAKLAIGASGRWLGSSGTAPQWNAPAALTKTDDTNVTLTLGGSASTALLNAASLTLGWTGTLSTARGGTGLSSFTANGIVYASSSSVLATGSALTWVGNVFTTTGGGGAKAKLQDNSLLLLNSGAIASGFVSFQRSDGTQKAAIASYYNVANEGGLEFIGPTNSTNAMLYSDATFTIGTTSKVTGGVNMATVLDSRTANTGFGLGVIGDASNTQIMRFAYGATAVGSIVISAATTTYNTISDQDLKNDLGVVTETDVIANTIIRDYEWIVDGVKARGPFAQEAHKVNPQAVTVGNDELDENGNKINPWQIDLSKYIPDIIVELQSLRKRVAELEAKG